MLNNIEIQKHRSNKNIYRMSKYKCGMQEERNSENYDKQTQKKHIKRSNKQLKELTFTKKWKRNEKHTVKSRNRNEGTDVNEPKLKENHWKGKHRKNNEKETNMKGEKTTEREIEKKG